MNAKTDPAGVEATSSNEHGCAAVPDVPLPGSGSGRAAHEVAQVFGTRIGVYGIGILGQSLLAYLLLPAGRGEYAVCVAFGSLLGVLFPISAAYGAQYYTVSGRISLSKCLCGAVGVCLAGSVVAAVVALPLIYSGTTFFRKADPAAFQLALWLVPLISVSSVAELQLAGLRRFMPLAGFLLLQSVTMVLGILVLAWKLDAGVNGALLALIAGYVVKLACCIGYLHKACGLRFELPSAAELRRIVGYGLRYHVAQVGNDVEPRIGVFVLGTLAGRADIGLFAAASTIMLRLGYLLSAVAPVLYPRVARNPARSMEAIGCSLRLICLTTAGAVAAFLAICEPVVRILLSEAFMPTVPLLWIMAPGVVAYAGANVFIAYFTGSDRPGICSSALWLSLTVNIAASLVLYPMLGIRSVAWAMTAGLFARGVFLAVTFHRTTGLSWRSLWLPRRGDASFLWGLVRSMLARGGRKFPIRR